MDVRLVADEADAAVAVGDEVGDAVPRAAGVVAEDDVRVDAAGRAVDEDRGDAGGDLGLQVAVVVAGGDDHQTVDPPCAEGQYKLLLAVGVLRAGPGEQKRPVGAGEVLDGPAQGE